MIEALEYMHSQNIAHRDLKLENMFVTKSMDIKIIDFGFVTKDKVTHLKSYKGTLTYMAPEIKEGKIYNGK